MAAIDRHGSEPEDFIILRELEMTAHSLDAALMQMGSLLDKVSRTNIFLSPNAQDAFSRKLQFIFDDCRHSLRNFEDLHREMSAHMRAVREAYDRIEEEIARLIASEKE